LPRLAVADDMPPPSTKMLDIHVCMRRETWSVMAHAVPRWTVDLRGHGRLLPFEYPTSAPTGATATCASRPTR
jgi:hypothetical protein